MIIVATAYSSRLWLPDDCVLLGRQGRRDDVAVADLVSCPMRGLFFVLPDGDVVEALGAVEAVTITEARPGPWVSGELMLFHGPEHIVSVRMANGAGDVQLNGRLVRATELVSSWNYSRTEHVLVSEDGQVARP